MMTRLKKDKAITPLGCAGQVKTRRHYQARTCWEKKLEVPGSVAKFALEKIHSKNYYFQACANADCRVYAYHALVLVLEDTTLNTYVQIYARFRDANFLHALALARIVDMI